jgi:hypothetical protein
MLDVAQRSRAFCSVFLSPFRSRFDLKKLLLKLLQIVNINEVQLLLSYARMFSDATRIVFFYQKKWFRVCLKSIKSSCSRWRVENFSLILSSNKCKKSGTTAYSWGTFTSQIQSTFLALLRWQNGRKSKAFQREKSTKHTNTPINNCCTYEPWMKNDKLISL